MRYSETFYRRRLPHIDNPGRPYFITSRLEGSIPMCELNKVKDHYRYDLIKLKRIEDDHERNLKKFNRRKKYLIEIDELLHKIRKGPTHLKNPKIAELLQEQLHRFDGDLYSLIAFSIMSNHFHVLLHPLQFSTEKKGLIDGYTPLQRIMQRIKGPSGLYSNRVLGLKGQFWVRENYDIYIRNEYMYDNVIRYILNNPVKVGIVKNQKNYEWNYYKGW